MVGAVPMYGNMTPEQRLQVRNMHEAGKSIDDIAVAVGAQKSQIKRLVELLEDGKGIGPVEIYFECQECGARFMSAGDLGAHVQVTHIEINDADEDEIDPWPGGKPISSAVRRRLMSAIVLILTNNLPGGEAEDIVVNMIREVVCADTVDEAKEALWNSLTTRFGCP